MSTSLRVRCAAMTLAARLLAAWVAAALVTVSTVARAQSAQVPLTPAESSQLRHLELRLDDVDGERAATSTLLPWTVVVLGLSAVVLGTTLGAAGVGSCEDDSCSSPLWPTWAVVIGAGVTTGGLVWLKLVREDIAELESRRYHLQMQIDGYEVLREARGQRAVLQVGGTF